MEDVTSKVTKGNTEDTYVEVELTICSKGKPTRGIVLQLDKEQLDRLTVVKDGQPYPRSSILIHETDPVPNCDFCNDYAWC